ncbi:MAG TPA: hemerythrin domain-containing protein [Candidatus Binataceae bacterium]|jgi:hemerythrin superfamily protein|nr:hemerythrin domain-containing protein [Candidatus Binataceae bacterium]
MNILDVLHADHTAVTNLFEQTRQAPDSAELGELFEKIRRELEVHIRAEEGIFYPEVERIGPEAAAAVATAIEQHGDAVVLIAELAKLGPDASKFKAKLKALEDGVKNISATKRSGFSSSSASTSATCTMIWATASRSAKPR